MVEPESGNEEQEEGYGQYIVLDPTSSDEEDTSSLFSSTDLFTPTNQANIKNDSSKPNSDSSESQPKNTFSLPNSDSSESQPKNAFSLEQKWESWDNPSAFFTMLHTAGQDLAQKIEGVTATDNSLQPPASDSVQAPLPKEYNSTFQHDNRNHSDLIVTGGPSIKCITIRRAISR